MRVLLLPVTLAALAAAPVFAQQQFGHAENLAPFIPSAPALVERMLEAARVKAGDVVYDLGSGDGRIIIAAAQKFGARAVGIELSADLCVAANARIKVLGLEDRVKVIHGSALRVDLSPADVVTMYLLTGSNERLKPNLERYLKPGARVVSNEFPIKGWKPAQLIQVRAGGMTHHIYLYEIAKK
jgi:predicted RNA methylase